MPLAHARRIHKYRFDSPPPPLSLTLALTLAPTLALTLTPALAPAPAPTRWMPLLALGTVFVSAATCEKVTVTGARAGAYTVGGSVNDAADVYSDDGKWRMFFAGPAPALSTRRARNLAAEEEEEEGGDAGETLSGEGGGACAAILERDTVTATTRGDLGGAKHEQRRFGRSFRVCVCVFFLAPLQGPDVGSLQEWSKWLTKS